MNNGFESNGLNRGQIRQLLKELPDSIITVDFAKDLREKRKEAFEVLLEETENVELVLELMREDFTVLKMVSDKLKGNAEFMLAAMDINVAAVTEIADNLRKNEDFMIKAIKKYPAAYFQADPSVKHSVAFIMATLGASYEEPVKEEAKEETPTEEVPEVKEEVKEELPEMEEPAQEEIVQEEVKEEIPEMPEVSAPSVSFEDMIGQTSTEDKDFNFKNSFSEYTQPGEAQAAETSDNTMKIDAPAFDFKPTDEPILDEENAMSMFQNTMKEEPAQAASAEAMPNFDVPAGETAAELTAEATTPVAETPVMENPLAGDTAIPQMPAESNAPAFDISAFYQNMGQPQQNMYR